MPRAPSRHVEVSPLKGPFAVLSPNVSSPQPNLFGPVTWQLGGISVQTVSCVIPSLVSALTSETCTFSASLAQLPVPIQLPRGAQGYVIVGASLSSPAPAHAIISTPKLIIQFGNQANGSQGFALLQPGVSYTNPFVSGSFNVAAVGGSVTGATVQVTVWALLLGRLGP